MKFVVSEQEGKREDLQHQKKDKCGVPSDEEENITHLRYDLASKVLEPKLIRGGFSL
jgi:hypothetical protein